MNDKQGIEESLNFEIPIKSPTSKEVFKELLSPFNIQEEMKRLVAEFPEKLKIATEIKGSVSPPIWAVMQRSVKEELRETIEQLNLGWLGLGLILLSLIIIILIEKNGLGSLGLSGLSLSVMLMIFVYLFQKTKQKLI